MLILGLLVVKLDRLELYLLFRVLVVFSIADGPEHDTRARNVGESSRSPDTVMYVALHE